MNMKLMTTLTVQKDVTDGDDTSSLSLSRKRPLSETNAEDRFEMIAQNTAVEIDLPEDIKEYLHCLLSGNIKNALSEVEKTLDERRPLML
ncbi:unnamed protein product [Rhizophagus irregularis]|nr:unnamed protein product [Rhizophagus irregularis]CAB4438325.1 unnamed protein product [Rhizophagus irregularis]